MSVMAEAAFRTEISRHVWDSRYRYREGDAARDRSIEDTWRRVAGALASVEREAELWSERFYGALEGFRFLPGGRIHAGAGTSHRVTLFNCFVMGVIDDSLGGIFDGLKEGALTMQQGGGVGYDFSTLRPRGTRARAAGTLASGPISFMRIWDSMCATLLSTGARRGAMMATLRSDHPDIEEFVEAKRDARELRHFNVSVQVFDDFMSAVRAGRNWPLVFPEASLDDEGGAHETVMRRWTGAAAPVACRVLRRVSARELWNKILRATYDSAEPGVLFMDRIDRANNLAYREHITATNPCGEIPLPPYGACDLGSLNLSVFVRDAFTASARLDWDALAETTAVATRMLDDAIDASHFPLPAQAEQARGTRRIGLGVTGLADALILLGLGYGSDAGRETAARAMRTVGHAAYRASIALAREKGAFPFFDRERYLEGPFIRSLPDDLRDGIARGGTRNSHLTAIAPTGTISLLANNVSSGIEPVFAFCQRRKVLERDGARTEYALSDYAFALWQELKGAGARLPPAFVEAGELSPEQHLEMQAALQPYVDNSISKTINVPESYAFADFQRVYDLAYDLGLKGCTTFRPNPVTGAVLEGVEHGAHCCTPEREAD
jgi:ribonucleoside-diphosphate reductase alpha chain